MIKKIILVFSALGFLVSSALAMAGPIGRLGQTIDDATVTTVINAKYLKSPLLNPFKINVDTKEGEVTLTGMVDTDLQFEKAVTIAQSTNGVDKVITDNLKIKESKAPMNDLLLTAKVKGTLLKHEYLNGGDTDFWPIQVESRSGVVYLSGKVSSKEQKQELIKTVEAVDGVQSVKTDIQMKE